MKHHQKGGTGVPKPPRGIGISRRLLLTLGSVVIGVVILFLFFLHHYAPPRLGVAGESHPSMALDTDNAASLISKIQQQPHQPMIVPFSPLPKKDSTTEEIKTIPESDNNQPLSSVFKEAADAPITVYQNTSAQWVPPQKVPAKDPATSWSDTQGKTENKYNAQNGQSEKMSFLQHSDSPAGHDVMHSTLHQAVSPFQISAGSIIPATLVTGINSDLPGPIFAKVRQDVFDTPTGNYLLIPQGSTLVGVYDSQIAYGQSRVLIVWSRLIFPNGASFDLENMPGADLTGMAGLHDLVDNHYFRLFGSALLMSVFGAGGQLSQPRNDTNQLTTQQILFAAMGQQTAQTGAQLMARNMNIQPTNKIRPGANFNVLLTRDMVLPGFYHFQ